MNTSYALTAREIDTRNSTPASAFLLQHDLRKALGRFSLESNVEWLSDTIIRNAPFTEDTYLNHGAYKEAYALNDYFVIKLCSQHNTTAAERTLLEIAEEEGLGGVFIPTTFANLHGFFVDLDHILDDEIDMMSGAWQYNEEDHTWVPDEDWEGIFATYVEIQPRIDKTAADIPGWAFVNAYEDGDYLTDPKTGAPIDIEILRSIGIDCREWLDDFLKFFGKEKLEKLAEFCDKYTITDLHNGNIGWLSGRPVIIDWQSPAADRLRRIAHLR